MGAICDKNHFAEPDTSGPTEFRPSIEYDQLVDKNWSPLQKFEHSMPFHLIRIDAYEGKIKRLVYAEDNCTLTF